MKKFWNWIKNSDDTRILRLEGPIDEESFWGDEITPQMFRDELESGEGDVTVWINSPGGNVFAAAEIYTMLKDYKGSITVKIDAIAASAASVVAMAGDTVQMSPVAMLMIHDPSTVAMGNTKDMEKAIEVLTEVKESIINAYELRTGMSRIKLSHLMDAETWMDATKAVELGFADDIMKRAGTENMEIPAVSMLFTEATLVNSLMDKIAAKCRIEHKEDPKPGVKADTCLERLNLIKNWR